jgi:hypothetical protein
MSTKLKVIRLKREASRPEANPRTKKKRRGRPKKSPQRPAGRRISLTRKRSLRGAKYAGAWLVEVLRQKKSGFSFHYWSGKKLVRTRDGAEKFADAKTAAAVAKKLIRSRPISDRVARVVPA